MSAYDEDICREFRDEFNSGIFQNVGKAEVFFTILSELYPSKGSKIDWSSIPGSIEDQEDDRKIQPIRFEDFFNKTVDGKLLRGPIVYIGDSITDFAIEGSVDDMRMMLSSLFMIPQHHYFIGENYLWCMCMSMEGGMGFGWSPKYMAD